MFGKHLCVWWFFRSYCCVANWKCCLQVNFNYFECSRTPFELTFKCSLVSFSAHVHAHPHNILCAAWISKDPSKFRRGFSKSNYRAYNYSITFFSSTEHHQFSFEGISILTSSRIELRRFQKCWTSNTWKSVGFPRFIFLLRTFHIPMWFHCCNCMWFWLANLSIYMNKCAGIENEKPWQTKCQWSGRVFYRRSAAVFNSADSVLGLLRNGSSWLVCAFICHCYNHSLNCKFNSIHQNRKTSVFWYGNERLKATQKTTNQNIERSIFWEIVFVIQLHV